MQNTSLKGIISALVFASVLSTLGISSQHNTQTSPSLSKPVKLPYHAREALKEFNRQYHKVEYSLKQMKSAKASNNTTVSEIFAKQIRTAVPKLESVLAQLKAEAKDQVNHPDIVAAEEKIDALSSTLSDSKQEDKPASSQQQSAKNAGLIDTLHQSYQNLNQNYFSKITGVPIYYNDLRPVKEFLTLIERFEKNEKAKAETLLASFEKSYGKSFNAVDQSTGSSSAAWDYENFKKGLHNITKTRTAMAEDLVNKTEQIHIAYLQRMHDFKRIAQHDVIREWVAMAKRFEPDNAKVHQLSASVEVLLSKDLIIAKEKIANVKWKAHASNAPANARELADRAMQWFNNDPEWGGRYSILAVSVRGPWSVQKRDLLGKVIVYGLPVEVAVQRGEDKKRGLARVFELTLRTFEKNNVKEEPPFEYPTVGNSRYMLSKNVER
jgi:DNA repair exonuclease SbcCD ATPase subunit